MRRLCTIIGVADVRRSFAWHQTLLGLPASEQAHAWFGQIVDDDGTVLLRPPPSRSTRQVRLPAPPRLFSILRLPAAAAILSANGT